MAYTYNDFTKAATDAGVLSRFDQNDLDYAKKYPEFGLSMVSLQRDLGNAKTNEQKLLATEAMNQLRKNYGSYWTGESGNRSYATSYGSKINDAMEKVNNYGPFKYSGQDDYKKLLDSVVNRGSFSYDPETDELFDSYRKTYLREGDRAAANALAQAASATGGMASSYANTAAQQAANYYAGQLADMIPQLRTQRYGEWQDEYANMLQALGAMDTDRGTEYKVYTDTYGRLQDALKNLQTQDESDYKRYLDMLNAEYQRDRDAVADAQQEWNNAWAIYEKTGQITGPLKDVMGAQAAAAASGGSGGGGGGGSGGGGGYSGGGGSSGGGSSGGGSSGGSTVYNGTVNYPKSSGSSGNANVNRGISGSPTASASQNMGGGTYDAGKSSSSAGKTYSVGAGYSAGKTYKK